MCFDRSFILQPWIKRRGDEVGVGGTDRPIDDNL